MANATIPKEIKDHWSDILNAAGEIGGWAEGYSHGYINSEETKRDLPAAPPDEVPLYEHDVPWSDYPHKECHASVRRVGDTEGEGDEFKTYYEFTFGTFAIFMVSDEWYAIMTADYDDEQADNERKIEVDGSVIVIYMM